MRYEADKNAIIPASFSLADLVGCCAVYVIYDFNYSEKYYKDEKRQSLLDVLKNTVNICQRLGKSLIIMTTNDSQKEYNSFFESVGFHSTPWINRDKRFSLYDTKVKLWWMSIQELTEKGIAL